MKKLFTLVLVMSVVFAGTAWAAQPMRLTMATGGVAGIYFPFGGILGQVMSDNSGVVEITAQVTGATVENLNLMGMGDVELALVQNDLSYYAYRGLEFYVDNPISNFKAITRLYPELLHTVAQVDSGIYSIADFVGRRISVGASGSGNEANCRQIFGFYGINYDNITPFFLPHVEAVNHFRDRQIDAFVFTTGTPAPGVMDVVMLRDVTFVPVYGAVRDAIIEAFPFFTADVIPANTYRGQTEDVETLAMQAIMVVREDIPEDIVYAMTKALFENLDAVRAGHAKGYELSLDTALMGLTIPLHPGAERYFREVGIIN